LKFTWYDFKGHQKNFYSSAEFQYIDIWHKPKPAPTALQRVDNQKPNVSAAAIIAEILLASHLQFTTIIQIYIYLKLLERTFYSCQIQVPYSCNHPVCRLFEMCRVVYSKQQKVHETASHEVDANVATFPSDFCSVYGKYFPFIMITTLSSPSLPFTFSTEQ